MRAPRLRCRRQATESVIDLFQIIVIGLIVAAYFYFSKRGRRADPVTTDPDGRKHRIRRGPVPGYARFPGPSLRPDLFDSVPAPDGLARSILSFETFGVPGRPRVCLRIAIPGAPDETSTIAHLTAMANALRTRLQVAAIAIEWHDDLEVEDTEDAKAVVILAQDGRGWSGVPGQPALTIIPPSGEAYGQSGVIGSAHNPGTGWYVPDYDDKGDLG